MDCIVLGRIVMSFLGMACMDMAYTGVDYIDTAYTVVAQVERGAVDNREGTASLKRGSGVACSSMPRPSRRVARNNESPSTLKLKNVTGDLKLVTLWGESHV